MEVAVQEARLGDELAAIEHFEAAAGLFGNAPPALAGWGTYLSFRLGVSYLRLGESRNCCARNTPQSCILPIRGGGLHSDEEGSRKAIEHFTAVLTSPVAEPVYRLKARWLLNIAYMTLGEHPHERTSEAVLDRSAHVFEGRLEPFESFPQFRERRQARLGVATRSTSVQAG